VKLYFNYGSDYYWDRQEALNRLQLITLPSNLTPQLSLSTPDGNRIPLSQVANVTIRNGAFMIYREGGRRYIPVKFSVRNRDLAGTIREVQRGIERNVRLPEGYHYEWAGEYESLRQEQRGWRSSFL